MVTMEDRQMYIGELVCLVKHVAREYFVKNYQAEVPIGVLNAKYELAKKNRP